MANEVTVGADPEVFWRKGKENYPVIGLLGGTKVKPRNVLNGAVQEDNVMAEFNVKPSTTKQSFSARVEEMLNYVKGEAQKHGCELYINPYAEFAAPYLDHPQARHIGCDPDYNAWKMERNPIISPDKLGLIRTASGHVHIGHVAIEDSPNNKLAMVRAMDIFVGAPYFCIYPETVRHKYYGKAGAYRPKPYGVEYRVLDNRWIGNPLLREWVFDATLRAFSNIRSIRQWINSKQIKYEDLVRAIDLGDTVMARKIAERFGAALPPVV